MKTAEDKMDVELFNSSAAKDRIYRSGPVTIRYKSSADSASSEL